MTESEHAADVTLLSQAPEQSSAVDMEATSLKPKGRTKQRKGKTPLPSDQLGLVTLPQLVEQLGLPVKWARRQVAEGKLPCVQIGPRYLFDPAAVVKKLKDRAARFNQWDEYT